MLQVLLKDTPVSEALAGGYVIAAQGMEPRFQRDLHALRVEFAQWVGVAHFTPRGIVRTVQEQPELGVDDQVVAVARAEIAAGRNSIYAPAMQAAMLELALRAPGKAGPAKIL